ncbi:MAG: hypothetical protein IIA87_00890 [Nanoarchaeota archaeon]|nr:hypothetical protein [Nanoarchaeota archaeon]
MNKLILLSSLLIFVTLSFVIAQDQAVSAEEEIQAGVTPDNPLWGIDRALENINLALTFDKSAKAEKGLKHALERLLEVKAMIEEEKIPDAEKAELAHKEKLTRVRAGIQELEEDNEKNLEEVVDLENALDDQEAELDEIRSRIRIKIEGITLTEEQIARLLAFINSLDENIERVRIDIENKEERTKVRIEQRTGRSRIEIEDGLGRLREERKVKAKIFDDFSRVKVELKFTIRATSKDEVIKEIIERFALTKEEANRLLKIERGDDEKEEVEICHIPPENPEEAHTIIIGAPAVSTHLAHGDSLGHCDNGSDNSITEQDEDKKELERLEKLRIKAKIKEKHGVSFAKVKIKLEFIDGTDRESIIKAIVKRIQLTEQEILDVIEFKQEVEEEEKEREIEVEIEDDEAEIEIKWDRIKMEFKLKTTNEKEILNEIALRLGVPVEEIRPFVEFEIETREEKEDLIEFKDENDEIDEEDKAECTVDANCEEDKVCVEGECENAPECTVDTDCDEDKICVESKCEST